MAWSTSMVLMAGPGALAQDVEVTAQMVGRQLPPAYYQRVRTEPDAFELRHGWIARTERAAQLGMAVSDTLPLMVIPALFSDSPEPHVSAELLQQVLFDGPSEHGTLTEFYHEASMGQFGVRGLVLPWIRTDVSLSEAVGESYGLGSDAQVGAYLMQSLEAADSVVDFGLFDNDGLDGVPNSGDDDGFADAVAFEFLEVSASCGGPGIWPHRYRLGGWQDSTGTAYEFVSRDTSYSGGFVRVNDYIIQSTVACDGANVQTATTIAHELGHVLGLPDLYDSTDGILPEQRRWVVGCWSLMAAGSWGCGTMNRNDWVRPTHFGAWEKERLGWLTLVEVVQDALGRDITLDPVITSGRVLKVPLSADEYYLVEYRLQQGFDLDLPASGVLVYHIDETKSTRPCPICRVQLEEADGNQALLRNFTQGGNRGEPGDAFGASGPGRFTPSTNPATHRNAGDASQTTFYDISLDGAVAHLKISTVGIALARLLVPFLQGVAVPLAAVEEDYLDSVGNQNGRYDVGDLRAYIQR
jgi:M6 family metalloprotease-like protein